MRGPRCIMGNQIRRALRTGNKGNVFEAGFRVKVEVRGQKLGAKAFQGCVLHSQLEQHLLPCKHHAHLEEHILAGFSGLRVFLVLAMFDHGAFAPPSVWIMSLAVELPSSESHMETNYFSGAVDFSADIAS